MNTATSITMSAPQSNLSVLSDVSDATSVTTVQCNNSHKVGVLTNGAERTGQAIGEKRRPVFDKVELAAAAIILSTGLIVFRRELISLLPSFGQTLSAIGTLKNASIQLYSFINTLKSSNVVLSCLLGYFLWTTAKTKKTMFGNLTGIEVAICALLALSGVHLFHECIITAIYTCTPSYDQTMSAVNALKYVHSTTISIFDGALNPSELGLTCLLLYVAWKGFMES